MEDSLTGDKVIGETDDLNDITNESNEPMVNVEKEINKEIENHKQDEKNTDYDDKPKTHRKKRSAKYATTTNHNRNHRTDKNSQIYPTASVKAVPTRASDNNESAKDNYAEGTDKKSTLYDGKGSIPTTSVRSRRIFNTDADSKREKEQVGIIQEEGPLDEYHKYTVPSEKKASTTLNKSRSLRTPIRDNNSSLLPTDNEKYSVCRSHKSRTGAKDYESRRSAKNKTPVGMEEYIDFDDYNQQNLEREKKAFGDYMSDTSRKFENEDEYWEYKSNQLDQISSVPHDKVDSMQNKGPTAKKRIFKIMADTGPKLPLRVAVITDHKVLQVFYEHNPKSKTFIDVHKCLKYFKKRRDKPELLKKEFEKTCNIPKYTCEYAQKEEFAFRNIFPTCVPFNYNRVKLTNLIHKNNNDDYFNASYINDMKGKTFCIASQCPIKEDVEKFWSMVYENHCTVIVSLLDHDDNKHQTCKYWPNEDKDISSDKFKIELLMGKKIDNLFVRDIRISPKKGHAPLVVRHMNFAKWKTCTELPKLGDFTKLRNVIVACLDDPIDALPLIHCSSGSGRTSVLIAFCMAFNAMLKRENFDICELVTYLKKQRLYNFDTEDKYVFLHKLLDLGADSIGLFATKK